MKESNLLLLLIIVSGFYYSVEAKGMDGRVNLLLLAIFISARAICKTIEDNKNKEN